MWEGGGEGERGREGGREGGGERGERGGGGERGGERGGGEGGGGRGGENMVIHVYDIIVIMVVDTMKLDIMKLN